MVRQLEARRQLHLTLLELDKRNFGTAQEHLAGAAILLGTPPARAPGPTWSHSPRRSGP
jgi:hypothetical protein